MVETESHARQIADRYLDQWFKDGEQGEVVANTVEDFVTHWVIGYNTRAFLNSREPRDSLAGGGPLIISKSSGVVRIGSYFVPIEDQLTVDEGD